MNKSYKKGYRYERKALEELVKQDYLAWRTPGSHSEIDIIAIKPLEDRVHIKLIQVKASKSKLSFNSLGDEEKARLIALAKRFYNFSNVDIELWIYDTTKHEKHVFNIKQYVLS